MKSDFILLLILWQRYRNIDDSLPLAETIGTYDEDEDTVEQNYLIILFMLLQKQEPFIHSRYKKVFYRTLSRGREETEGFQHVLFSIQMRVRGESYIMAVVMLL